MKTYKIGVVWQMYGLLRLKLIIWRKLSIFFILQMFRCLIMVSILRVVLRLMLKVVFLTKLTK